jgi:hypothetical protein
MQRRDQERRFMTLTLVGESGPILSLFHLVKRTTKGVTGSQMNFAWLSCPRAATADAPILRHTQEQVLLTPSPHLAYDSSLFRTDAWQKGPAMSTTSTLLQVPRGSEELAPHYDLTLSQRTPDLPAFAAFGRWLGEAASVRGLSAALLHDGVVHEAVRRLDDGRLTIGLHLDYFALWQVPDDLDPRCPLTVAEQRRLRLDGSVEWLYVKPASGTGGRGVARVESTRLSSSCAEKTNVPNVLFCLPPFVFPIGCVRGVDLCRGRERLLSPRGKP